MPLLEYLRSLHLDGLEVSLREGLKVADWDSFEVVKEVTRNRDAFGISWLLQRVSEVLCQESLQPAQLKEIATVLFPFHGSTEFREWTIIQKVQHPEKAAAVDFIVGVLNASKSYPGLVAFDEFSECATRQ